MSVRPSGGFVGPSAERSVVATFARVGQRPVPVELPTVVLAPPAQ